MIKQQLAREINFLLVSKIKNVSRNIVNLQPLNFSTRPQVKQNDHIISVLGCFNMLF